MVDPPHEDAEQRVASPEQLHFLRHEVFFLGLGFTRHDGHDAAGGRHGAAGGGSGGSEGRQEGESRRSESAPRPRGQANGQAAGGGLAATGCRAHPGLAAGAAR